jgi:hypothetical protein
MATSKKPPAKSSASRALTVWEQKMVEAAAKSAKAERAVSGLKGISTRGGILTVDEQPVPGNELDVVVLVAVHENQYHTKAYDPNTPQIPDCYAFGDPDADDPEGSMAPHEEAEDKQGDDNGLCANCWANAMGSAQVGRGKACKNVRRLALVTADALESAESLADTEVRVLKVPVMSVKGWAMYVRNTLDQELHRPYWGVVTTIKVVPDAKSQFRVTFAFKELVDFDDEVYAALEKKQAEVKPQLVAPYMKMEEAPPPPPRGRAPARPPARPAAAPLKPQGRAAEAMAKAVGKGKPAAAPAAPARKAKY